LTGRRANTVFDLVQNPPTTIAPTLNFGLMQQLNQGPVLLAPPKPGRLRSGGQGADDLRL
jgi:hypothetical protein